MIMEMFHTLMDLLEVWQNINKLYLSITTPIVFSIQAYEDFNLTAGCAYFLSYILQFFGMNRWASASITEKEHEDDA